MGRKTVTRLSKNSSTKPLMSKDNLYVNNIAFNSMVQICDSPDSEFSEQIILNCVIIGVCMMMMAQISISAQPENSEYVDRLPSYKDIKKKFITGLPGRSTSALAGIAKSYPWAMQDPMMQVEDPAIVVNSIVASIIEFPSPNIKRIKPSSANWQQYARGEMGSAFGQMISCPSTNLKTVNIDGTKVKSYGIKEAIQAIGISPNILEKHNLTTDRITQEISSIFLVNSSGIPVQSLEYDEPSSISSKIQNLILGTCIKRTGVINSDLQQGLEPSAAITISQIEKHLTKYEFIAYNFAIRSGDKNILKKYTDLVKSRALNKD